MARWLLLGVGRSGGTGCLAATLGELGGQQDRLYHAAWIRGAGARDVEGGAVIDRGADDGEADGDVDPPFEADQLQRDMSLIVVHGDHGIEFAALQAVEERIGRVRAAYLEPLGLPRLNSIGRP